MEITVDSAAVSATTGGRSPDSSAPLLVMVHGAALDKTIWQLQTRFFSHRGFSVLALTCPATDRRAAARCPP